MPSLDQSKPSESVVACAMNAPLAIDVLLAHIDQELSWIAEATRRDGWSSQLIVATIATLAFFVFQSLDAAGQVRWPDLLLRVLLFSYSWDIVTVVYSWIRHSSLSTAHETSERGTSTRVLAPARAPLTLTVGRAVFLIAISWYYAWSVVGPLAATIIIVHLTLFAILRLLVLGALLWGDWYPPLDVFRPNHGIGPFERILAIGEMLVVTFAATRLWMSLPLLGSPTTLPAAGIVAISYLAHQLLTRDSTVLLEPALRELRRDLALGNVDTARASSRLTDILLGEPLETAARPLLADHEVLIAESEQLVHLADELLVVIAAGSGPLTKEESSRWKDVLTRMRDLGVRAKDLNEKTKRVFVGKTWAALRLRLDARRSHASAHLRKTYKRLDDQSKDMLESMCRLREAVDKRTGAVDNESGTNQSGMKSR